jgi:hypothetical protein
MGTYFVLAAAPTRNEAVIAVGGAAAALGGLILVFLGVVVTSYQGYGREVDKAVLKPYKAAALALLGVFALSLLSATLSVAWLTTGGGAGALYEVSLWTFFALLLAVFIVAIGTVYRVVLK